MSAHLERGRAAAAWVLTGAAAVALPLGAGYGFAQLFAPTLQSRYFPWLTGRALGIAAYVALTALVMLGVWMRHPWRARRPLLHAETRLRVHATLATATIALVAGHLISLASDKYAGVGWVGAFVPFRAHYRPTAVSLGAIAMVFMVVLFVTARAAGRVGARHWLAYHRLAVANFALVWFHGVLAGTDTVALRLLYVVSGGTVVALTATRYLLGRVARPVEVDVGALTPRADGPDARRGPESHSVASCSVTSLEHARARRQSTLHLVEAPRFALPGENGARLLAGPPASRGAESYDEHRARLGALTLSDFDAAALRRTIRESGLLGRGGGGFPTAAKFDVAADAPGTAIVVVNASEGEPASRKDRTLLALRPHLVIDGAQLAAVAVGADDVVVYTHRSHGDANQALRAALAQRHDLAVRVRVVEAPETYIAGETSAVVSYLDGRGALPRRGVIPAARAGIAGRPTVVNNLETLSHLALIARYGAAWFAEVGAPEAPGSTLLTLNGAVTQPGLVVEVVGPVTIGEVLATYGGINDVPRAVLLGGYEGTWIPGETAWRTPVERHRLSRLSMSLGCGVVAVLGEEACGLAQTARLVSWLATQSAGQCGPCVLGLPRLSDELAAIVAGRARKGDLRRLRELATSVRGRGACGHPTGVVTLIDSALDTFADELRSHLRGEVCETSRELLDFPLPETGVGK